jgi:hypothetical protein
MTSVVAVVFQHRYNHAAIDTWLRTWPRVMPAHVATVIIAQSDDMPAAFGVQRGRLFNAGFAMARSRFPLATTFMFFIHLDIAPEDVGRIMEPLFTPDDVHVLMDAAAGVVAVKVSRAKFEAVNGFSNSTYGTGAEVVDVNLFLTRVLAAGGKLTTTPVKCVGVPAGIAPPVCSMPDEHVEAVAASAMPVNVDGLTELVYLVEAAHELRELNTRRYVVHANITLPEQWVCVTGTSHARPYFKHVDGFFPSQTVLPEGSVKHSRGPEPEEMPLPVQEEQEEEDVVVDVDVDVDVDFGAALDAS